MDIRLEDTPGAPARTPRPHYRRLLMPCPAWMIVAARTVGRRLPMLGLLAALAAPGCGHEEETEYSSVT